MVRSVYRTGLGEGIWDTVKGWVYVLTPWGYAYRPSTPAPVAAGAKLQSAEEVYTLLNQIIAMISDGLGRARGDAALTAQGEALSRELAQVYQRAGTDLEWAKGYVPGFMQRVIAWSSSIGGKLAGGGQAFQQAVSGSSFTTQVGKTIGGAAADVGAGAGAALGIPPDVGKWLLPVGAGLLLVLLLRR